MFLRFKVKYPQTKREPIKTVHRLMSSELLVEYALCHVASGAQNIPVIVMYAVYRVFNPNHGNETEMLRPKYKA
jgi:hypothetical protein